MVAFSQYGVTTEADLVRKLKSEKAGRSEMDDEIIGAQACRIEIPLTDAVFLRYVADQLRGFAARLDSHSRMPDVSDRVILCVTQREAREISARLKRRASGKDVKR